MVTRESLRKALINAGLTYSPEAGEDYPMRRVELEQVVRVTLRHIAVMQEEQEQICEDYGNTLAREAWCDNCKVQVQNYGAWNESTNTMVFSCNICSNDFKIDNYYDDYALEEMNL